MRDYKGYWITCFKPEDSAIPSDIRKSDYMIGEIDYTDHSEAILYYIPGSVVYFQYMDSRWMVTTVELRVANKYLCFEIGELSMMYHEQITSMMDLYHFIHKV
jgi:hypothetical protein